MDKADDGPKVSWLVTSPGSNSAPNIEVLFMCYKKEPKLYTRHTCTARPKWNHFAFYQFSESDCTNGKPVGDCDGFLSQNRQCSPGSRGDEDWRVRTSPEGANGIDWWNSGVCGGSNGWPYLRAIYYCWK